MIIRFLNIKTIGETSIDRSIEIETNSEESTTYFDPNDLSNFMKWLQEISERDGE